MSEALPVRRKGSSCGARLITVPGPTSISSFSSPFMPWSASRGVRRIDGIPPLHPLGSRAAGGLALACFQERFDGVILIWILG